MVCSRLQYSIFNSALRCTCCSLIDQSLAQVFRLTIIGINKNINYRCVSRYDHGILIADEERRSGGVDEFASKSNHCVVVLKMTMLLNKADDLSKLNT